MKPWAVFACGFSIGLTLGQFAFQGNFDAMSRTASKSLAVAQEWRERATELKAIADSLQTRNACLEAAGIDCTEPVHLNGRRMRYGQPGPLR